MQEKNERLERSEPFRRLRVGETICKRLEKKMKQEGFQGAFNSYVETKLMELTNDSRTFTPDTGIATIAVELLNKTVHNNTIALDKVSEISQQFMAVVARAYAEAEMFKVAEKGRKIVDVKALRSIKSDAEDKNREVK